METDMRLANRAKISALCITLGAILTACGTGGPDPQTDPAGSRPEIKQLGGKADVPAWIMPVPADEVLACDITVPLPQPFGDGPIDAIMPPPPGGAFTLVSEVEGDFSGSDSAHMHRMLALADTPTTLTFAANYMPQAGAAIAVYGADGAQVAYNSASDDNTVSVTFTAAQGGMHLVAVYSLAWSATGHYTLGASCGQQPQGQVTLKTDKDGYELNNEIVQASLHNGLDETIYLHGCAQLQLEKKDKNGNWTWQGPTHYCAMVWPNTPKELEAGETHDEGVYVLTTGTWRIKAEYGLGCDPTQPMSANTCQSVDVAYSPAFDVVEIVNECWGAWLDETGTCRGPADGVRPDHCCDDERQQHCSRLQQRYQVSLEEARQCSPYVLALQCYDEVPTALGPCACTTAVNSGAAQQTLLDLQQEYGTFKCLPTNVACPAVMCAPPSKGNCNPDSSSPSGGRCADTSY